MTSVAELYALQELDLALAANRAALAEVDALLGNSEALEQAQSKAKERQESLRAAEKHSKDLEFEADEQRRKIEPVEKRLYGGSVTNPKELEDLQLDLESLQRRRAELDDRALDAMEAVEAAKQAFSEAEGELERADAAFRGDQDELGGRRQVLESEFAGLEQRRADRAEGIDAAMMTLYDRLASIRQGRAVAKVERGACQGCRISLPTNVLQRARSGVATVQCSSCERILYLT